MRLSALALLVIAVVAAGWTALWFYAAGEAQHTLDAWLAQESAQGRQWTCPRRTIAGFPFALELSCDSPRFAGRVLEEQAQGSLAALRVGIGVTDPHRATVTPASPLTYRTLDGGTDLAVHWSDMTLALDGVPDQVTTAALSGTDVTVAGRIDAADLRTQHAAKAEATLAGLAGTTVEFTLALGGAVVPALDQFMGGQQAADFAASGRLTQAVFGNDKTPAELIERWRLANGEITLASARLARGSSQVTGSGLLRLDDRHCATGTLDASFAGLEPILRRYGIDPNLAKAGSILNSLFGHHDGAARPPSASGDIRLPIQVRGCRLGIGPVLTPVVLAPFY